MSAYVICHCNQCIPAMVMFLTMGVSAWAWRFFVSKPNLITSKRTVTSLFLDKCKCEGRKEIRAANFISKSCPLPDSAQSCRSLFGPC